METVTKSPWKRLSELLNLDKAEVTQLYMYAIFSGIISLSLPLGIQSVIHFIQGGQITTSWVVLVALVIGGVILTGVLQIMQLRLTENIQQRIFVRYTFDFAFRFPRMNRQDLEGKNPSELVNRFFDVINLQKGVAKVLLDFSSSALQITFSLIVLSFYHPFYIVFSLALVVLIYMIFKPIIRYGFQTSLSESKYKYKTAYWLQEIARADWSFRLVPNGDLALKRLDEHAKGYLNSRDAHFKVLWKQYSWMIGIKSIVVASLLGLGGYLVIDQQMNLGQFVAAEILILLLLGAVEKMIQLMESLYDVFTSLEKLGQVQDIKMTYEESSVPVKSDQLFPMEVINTSSAEAAVVLKVNEGKHVFIDGGHQLEVTQLLRQLIDPSSSAVFKPRWNNTIPTVEILGDALEHIGWFTQETHLFEGTLRENILLGRTTASLEDLKLALDTVSMSDFVSRQNKGYEAELTERHRLTSEVERERILIARSLVHHPALLLISFHGSALTANEQMEILDSIKRNYTETTIVCAAPTMIADAKHSFVIHSLS
jgi:ABC-type bacteriocin/lantibiotic exporter with double-glycine peptidase domain